jgi:hypothetical protein
MGYSIPCCGSRIKKKPLKGGVWLYAGYRKGCCCFAYQKRGTAGLTGNINDETGEVHNPWKQYQTD